MAAFQLLDWQRMRREKPEEAQESRPPSNSEGKSTLWFAQAWKKILYKDEGWSVKETYLEEKHFVKIEGRMGLRLSLPVHDAVKGEIAEGPTLGELQSMILLSVSSYSENTVCMWSRAGGVTTKVLLLSVLWTHPKVQLLVLSSASSRTDSCNS